MIRRALPSWHLGLGAEIGYLFWAIFVLEANFAIYGGVWPLWIQELGAPVSVVGLVLGANGLLRLVFLAPLASVADRFEPRRLLLLARGVAIVGLASAAVATHWTHLWLMVVTTAFAGITFPLAMTRLSTLAGDDRVRAFSLVFGVGPAVALAVAPFGAGLLIAQFGLRSAFVTAAILATIALVLFARLGPFAAPEDAAREARVSYRDTLRQPGVSWLLALMGVMVFAIALGLSLLPNYLVDVRGVPASIVATLGGVGAIGTVIYGLILSRNRRLQRLPLVAIAIGVALTAASLAIVAGAVSLPAIVLGSLGRGAFMSAEVVLLGVLGQIVASGVYRSRVYGLSEMIGVGAYFSAPVFAGLLFDVDPVLPVVLSVLASLALVPVLIAAQRVVPGATRPEPSKLTSDKILIGRVDVDAA